MLAVQDDGEMGSSVVWDGRRRQMASDVVLLRLGLWMMESEKR